MTRHALLLALALVAAALPLSRADDNPVQTIVGDVVYENGTYTFYNPIVIPAGNSLTFRNATIWLDIPDRCVLQTCTPQIDNKGTFRIERSTVDTHNFSSTDGYRVDSIAATLEVTNSTLYRYNVFQALDGGNARFYNNTFSAGVVPAEFGAAVSGHFILNAVEDSHDGISVLETSVPIHDNAFHNVTNGISIDVREAPDVASQATVRSADVQRNVVEESPVGGIFVAVDGGGTIANNTVRDSGTALTIWVTASSSTITRWPPTARHNVLDGNTIGLNVGGSAGSGTPIQTQNLDVQENAFENATSAAIHVNPILDTLTVAIDATDGWWGSSSGPGAGAVDNDDNLATVTTSPYATSTPSWRVGR